MPDLAFGAAVSQLCAMQPKAHSDACANQSGCRWLRHAAAPVVFGLLATLVVAWSCVLWSPTQAAFDPFDSPSEAVETVDPDGVRGLHYHEYGFGWSHLYFRGARFGSNGKADVLWSGPYGGTYHRLAGWPIHAMRSRVEVLDSQAAGRHSEGQPAPNVPPQRRRWRLPWGEVIRRGVASNDLPAWMHAKPDRRVPLIPLPAGFAFDAFFYAVLYLISARLVRLAERIRIRHQLVDGGTCASWPADRSGLTVRSSQLPGHRRQCGVHPARPIT